MKSYEGWVALETGQIVHPQSDWNFILFPEPNVAKHGVNCKIQIVTLLTTDLREYMLQGGICRAIVRGTWRTAAAHEGGWSPRSNRYLSVSWIMCEQGPDDDEELINQEEPLSDDEEMAEGDSTSMADEEIKGEPASGSSSSSAAQAQATPGEGDGNGNGRKRSPEPLNGKTKKLRKEIDHSNSVSQPLQ